MAASATALSSSSYSWRQTTLSLSSASPSSSSSSSSSSPHSKIHKRAISVPKLLQSGDEPRLLIPEKKASSVIASETIKSEERERFEARIDTKKLNKTLKSLFGGRFLWRRIFSASKKVRSIILLNVITVVYASTRVWLLYLDLPTSCRSRTHLGSCIIQASDIPVLKEVEAMMDPAAFTAVRFALSAVPFLPCVFWGRNDTRIRKAGTELGVWVSLGYLSQALGLLTSDAGRASFISTLTVIVVPLLDGIFGAVAPPLTWFGAVLSVAGVAMLESSGSPPCVGDLFNFFSAIFFGIHMLRTERISRATKKEDFIPLLGYEVCVVALFSIIWYILGGWLTGKQGLDLHLWTWETFWASSVSFPWIPALYTGVLSTGLCLLIEMVAMRDISATETAIIYGLEPVWGAGFAWFLLGERWDTIGWVGAALVLGGSLTVQMVGSLPSNNSGDTESVEEEVDHKPPSREGSNFSASPVVVRPDKQRFGLPKK